MEIKHTDGTIVNTDNLPDIHAMILEKAEELRVLCTNEKIQMALSIGIASKTKKSPSVSFWNVKTSNSIDYDTMDASLKGMMWTNFFRMIDAFVYSISNGNLLIVQSKNPESPNY